MRKENRPGPLAGGTEAVELVGRTSANSTRQRFLRQYRRTRAGGGVR